MANIPTRLNNPGDIKDMTTGKFKQFNTPEEGYSALVNDLNIKMSGKSKTGVTPDSDLSHFSSIYAPASDKNDPVSYANNLAKQLNVPVTTKIKDLQPRIHDFARAIATNEGYQGPNNMIAGDSKTTPTIQPINDTTQTLQPITSDIIKQNVLKLQNANASSGDIEEYVKRASQEMNIQTTSKTDTSTPITDALNKTNTNPEQNPDVTATVNDMYNKGKTTKEVQDYIHGVREGTIQPSPVPLDPNDAMTGKEYAQGVGEQFTQGGQHIVDSITGGADTMSKGFQQISNGNVLEGGLNTIEGGAKAFLGTFTGGLQTIFAPFTPIVQREVARLAENNPNFTKTLNDISTPILKPMSDLAVKHPEEAGVISDAVNALLTVVGEKITGGKNETTVEDLFKKDTYIKPKVEVPSAKIKSSMTSEEISNLGPLSEKDMAKLSPTQRSEYISQQTENIGKVSEASKAIRDSDIAKETERVTAENKDLTTKLDETKNTTATETKPLARQSLKDNSELFVEKVENGFSNGNNLKTKVSAGDLETFLEDQIDNPTQLDFAKKQLGLDKLKTTLPNGNIQYKDTTLGDIWKNSKDLGQTLSSSSRAGAKVFSPEEMATMNNIKLLTDFLGKQGMDLTEANNFWSTWTKLRKRILNEIKPFDTEANQKMPFENTLGQASNPLSKGYTQAKNFVSNLEEQFKLPKGSLTKDTEDILSQLDANKIDKANIQKMKTEINRQIKEQKAASLSELGAKQFNSSELAAKAAKTKKIIKTVILSVLGIGALETPIGKTVIRATTGL
jgi:hypothetical protein